jgi:hypothetical protein
VFDDVPVQGGEEACILRVRMTSSVGGGGRLAGTWTVSNEGASIPYVLEVDRTGGARERLTLPSSAFDGAGPVTATFSNGGRGRSMTAIFEGDTAVELLCGHIPFAVNYARAMLVVLSLLATLAALGVTAGALFTFPVASFVAMATALIVVISQAFVRLPGEGGGCSHPGHHHEEPERSWVHEAGEAGLRGIASLVRPVADAQPLSCVSDGVVISRHLVLSSLVLFGVLYPLAIAVPGVLCLRRRELAA